MNKTLFFGSDRSLRCHNVCLSVHRKVFGIVLMMFLKLRVDFPTTLFMLDPYL